MERPPLVTATPPMPPAIGHKLTKQQIAKHFGVGVRTVESWMDRKWLPYIKLGKAVRFDLEEVNHVVAEKFGRNRRHFGIVNQLK